MLLLAAACAYLFLQRYLRYTDDGGMYFALPFLEETAAEPDVQPGERGRGTGDEFGHRGAGESEPAEEPYGDRRLLGLDAPPADAETLNALLAQTGANGFVCSLRDNAGLVYYTSTAALRDAVASGAADAQTLSQLCQEMEALAVARLNCFHDSYYALGQYGDRRPLPGQRLHLVRLSLLPLAGPGQGGREGLRHQLGGGVCPDGL